MLGNRTPWLLGVIAAAALSVGFDHSSTNSSQATQDAPKAAAPAAPSAEAKPLIGQWTVDPEAIANSPEMQQLPEAERKQALEMATQMAAQMTFEFTGDGKLVMAFGDQKKEGTYSVKEAKGDELKLATTVDGKAEDITVKTAGDKLVLTDPKGQQITLIRKK